MVPLLFSDFLLAGLQGKLAGETGLVESVFKATREAGRQLVKDGRISEDTQIAVSKELMPRDAYYKAAQDMLEQMKKTAMEKC